MSEKEIKKLSKSCSSYQYTGMNSFGYVSPSNNFLQGDINYPTYHGSLPFSILDAPITYQQELAQCRFFYRYDPFASTVVNRMSEMIAGKLNHRKNYCTDEEFNYFKGVGEKLTTLIQTIALEYLVAGMAIPDYIITKAMGTRIHAKLGRKRYSVPDSLWVRNSDNIILKRQPASANRSVYLKIPSEERDFILNKGVRNDGTDDKILYNQLVSQFPEYVSMILEGKSIIPLYNAHPILRKPPVNCDYPQPFLVPALRPLKHKMQITKVDSSIANRAIEAIRLIKSGNNEYPVLEDDDACAKLRDQMRTRSSIDNQELVYDLYTNHTVDISWVYPPFDTLLSPDKFLAVDADIFMAMGFSRILLTGEALRSNAGGSELVILGPLATLTEARDVIIEWIKYLYIQLADLNNFDNIPEPIFDPLTTNDAKILLQYASSAYKDGAISLDSYAQLYNTNFDKESLQRSYEETVAPPTSVAIPVITDTTNAQLEE